VNSQFWTFYAYPVGNDGDSVAFGEQVQQIADRVCYLEIRRVETSEAVNKLSRYWNLPFFKELHDLRVVRNAACILGHERQSVG
jgi:hypothetical protein